MRIPLGLLVLVFIASIASAATAVRASIEQLTRKSVLVLRTRCVSVEARFTADRSTIETYVKLETLESLAGTAPVTLTALCRGGKVGDKALRVPGQARFTVGEEDVVFLRMDPRGNWRVLGWCQGKFRVVRDPETKIVEAVQELDGLCFVRGPDEKTPVSTKPERLALADLTRRIAAARATPADSKSKEGHADGTDSGSEEGKKDGDGTDGEKTRGEDESAEEADSGKD